eukprot:CAMPEP_0197317970 /NCGR_PEP_ID=MMETSP0891-20130614/49202_1 /TAXON_ID=44058 ORGANISM="Aureoumbra lagunensis, Strain CCMP1510" /NCGR_SAMPLE_ID=MMETSP0891 /ASSEMBLY_ACC=CAM_ASM_000534 /LENGTH=422 /DNA_ID=CAMNT_0042808197 /DNA_START=1135 /DNA_END=2403 /DNA_ORIENTATION=-
MKSADAAVHREAQFLAQKAEAMTNGLNEVLIKVPTELERMDNLTGELIAKAEKDRESLNALEIAVENAKKMLEAERSAATARKRSVDRAVQEAEKAATDAFKTIEDTQNTLAATAVQNDHSSENSLSQENKERLEALTKRASELHLAAKRAEEMIQKAMTDQSQNTQDSLQKQFNQVSEKATAQAESAVEKFVQELKARTSSEQKSSKRCDSFAELSRLADEAVRTYLDGDRVGDFDYALGAAGAKIVKKLTSLPYTPPNRVVPTSIWHAMGRDAGVGRPEDAISQRVTFGSCFAFAGNHGSLTVRLSAKLHPFAVSLEHIHSALCNPVHNLNCSSAPRDFRILGRDDTDPETSEPFLLGQFQYDALARDKPTVQTFPLDSIPDHPIDLISLEVLSNHGHPDYTCVYRFRVHGDPHSPSSST